MAEITAASVKELRERTGAGMMDCKKALAENNGEMEAAGRLAARQGPCRRRQEGRPHRRRRPRRRCRRRHEGRRRRSQFRDRFRRQERAVPGLRQERRELVLKTGNDVEALKDAAYPTGGTVEEKLTDNIATIGENQSLRRAAVLEVERGRRRQLRPQCRGPGPGQDRRSGRARERGRCRRAAGAWQAARDAHRRRQPAGAQRRRSRSRSDGARARDRRRKGQRERQAGQHRREDGRRRSIAKFRKENAWSASCSSWTTRRRSPTSSPPPARMPVADRAQRLRPLPAGRGH